MNILHDHEFTADEINLIELAGVTIADVRDVLSKYGEQELDTAIGTAVQISKGHVPPIENPQVQKEVPTEVARHGQEASEASEASEEGV